MPPTYTLEDSESCWNAMKDFVECVFREAEDNEATATEQAEQDETGKT